MQAQPLFETKRREGSACCPGYANVRRGPKPYFILSALASHTFVALGLLRFLSCIDSLLLLHTRFELWTQHDDQLGECPSYLGVDIIPP